MVRGQLTMRLERACGTALQGLGPSSVRTAGLVRILQNESTGRFLGPAGPPAGGAFLWQVH